MAKIVSITVQLNNSLEVQCSMGQIGGKPPQLFFESYERAVSKKERAEARAIVEPIFRNPKCGMEPVDQLPKIG